MVDLPWLKFFNGIVNHKILCFVLTVVTTICNDFISALFPRLMSVSPAQL